MVQGIKKTSEVLHIEIEESKKVSRTEFCPVTWLKIEMNTTHTCMSCHYIHGSTAAVLFN